MERLLTIEEVEELLRIDPVTVRRLVTRGELIGYRIAGEYRFTLAGVESFVESQRVVVTMEPGPNHPLAKFTERARKVLSPKNGCEMQVASNAKFTERARKVLSLA